MCDNLVTLLTESRNPPYRHLKIWTIARIDMILRCFFHAL
ncbi:hypothetical protein APHCR_1537 [Anaplasma phagocytophilum str. CR1007]|nr:hypothetical protein APHCR_1537 [Anaplasma phagocytophilum str. CR1007]